MVGLKAGSSALPDPNLRMSSPLAEKGLHPRVVQLAQREREWTPIHIRPFQPSDSEQVQSLFLTSMTVEDDSPWRRAMRAQYIAPLSFFSYGLITWGLLVLLTERLTRPTSKLFTARIGIAMVVTGASVFSLHRFLLEFGFKRTVRQILETDLRDIVSHYGLVSTSKQEGLGGQDYIPHRKSGFWVAEIGGKEHKPEIIGTVGLDSSTSENTTSSELRRMVVSRHHRRKGVALQLIKTVLAHARAQGTKSIFLSTSSYQNEAIKMYKGLGWRFERKQNVSFLSQPIYMLHFDLDVDSCRL